MNPAGLTMMRTMTLPRQQWRRIFFTKNLFPKFSFELNSCLRHDADEFIPPEGLPPSHTPHYASNAGFKDLIENLENASEKESYDLFNNNDNVYPLSSLLSPQSPAEFESPIQCESFELEAPTVEFESEIPQMYEQEDMFHNIDCSFETEEHDHERQVEDQVNSQKTQQECSENNGRYPRGKRGNRSRKRTMGKHGGEYKRIASVVQQNCQRCNSPAHYEIIINRMRDEGWDAYCTQETWDL